MTCSFLLAFRIETRSPMCASPSTHRASGYDSSCPTCARASVTDGAAAWDRPGRAPDGFSSQAWKLGCGSMPERVRDRARRNGHIRPKPPAGGEGAPSSESAGEALCDAARVQLRMGYPADLVLIAM